MSRPDPRQQAAAIPAAFAGAIDLSALKKRAAAPPAGPGGPAAPGAAPAEPAQVSPYVVDVDESTFGSVLQASSQVLVVVDLWADWAEPGKPLSDILQRLAAAAGGSWILARVNVDANPRIVQAFGAQSLPMVVALAQGQPVTDPLTAALPEPQVRQWIASLLDALRDHLPGIKEAEARAGGQDAIAEPEEDPRFVAAEQALADGDYAAAELAYQQILAAEPGNAEARAALAQTGLLARVEQHAPDAIAKADSAPDDVPAQRDAADVQLADGDIEGAFARLVATVRRTSGDDRTAAREHLVELFSLFPPDDEQVIRARRALAAALY
jgi:putative thioredoxin